MRISERSYAVTGLAYSPPWNVNAGFITGDEMTLIVDTGGNAAAAATIHGYALAASPANALCVINTEKHFDHIGGNHYFRQLGVDIWGHQGIARTAQEFQGEIEEFNLTIPNRARRAHREATVFFDNTQAANPSHPVSSGMVMELGHCKVEILLTPGHTPTNLSVWVPEEGVLYCGDCLTNLYLPNLDAGTPDAWPGWLESIEGLRRLRPRAIVCGHGPVATDDRVPHLLDQVSAVLLQAIQLGISPTAD